MKIWGFPRIQRTFCYVKRDLVRVFYFVFVNSIQSKKGLCLKNVTSRVYLILPLCLKFYVCSRFVFMYGNLRL